MRILLTDNNFKGAYGSFQCFYDEIERAFQNARHEVYRVCDVRQAIDVYEKVQPDFSLGLGKYFLFDEGRALCDVYNVEHYQWIIDNPVKVAPSKELKNFVPVFIDKEFSRLWSQSLKEYLFLPLGFEGIDFCNSNRKRGIVFCGQLKNPEQILDEINASPQKNLLSDFINRVVKNLNASFIAQYLQYLNERHVVDRKEFFRLANSYLRCFKRLKVLRSIKNYPLILAGDVKCEELLRQSNVLCLGKVPYADSLKLFSEYEFALNVSPNYACCVHDRIVRALSVGSRVITDKNAFVEKIFGAHLNYFDYDALNESEMCRVRKCDRVELERILRQFEWKNIVATVIKHHSERNLP